MNKTQRILRYLSIHGPATSRQIVDGLNMEKTGHVAALLRGYREKGRVLYNADMIWSISPEYDAQRSADIMAAVDLLKRAGYTVAPPCEKRQPTRVMQERCTGREAECEKLRRDAERIEWLEDQTKKSRTGISFDYHRYAEDGYVVNHGYRFMRRHFASGFKDSLRKAIDAAMQETTQ